MREVGKKASLRRLAYGGGYRPGIDIALLVAIACSTIDIASLLLPWLVGINSTYTSGKGLTYTVVVTLSGINLLGDIQYLNLLLLPPLLTLALLVLSLRAEGLIPPRVGYQTKSRIILIAAGILSMLPAFSFLNTVMIGNYSAPQSIPLVSRWELGGAATMPTYAGLGFFFAFGLRMIKE